VKVVELQRRGVPHFHAVIRLDAATDPDQPPAAPDTAVTAGEFAQLVHLAARRARLTIPATDGDGNPRQVVFGEQTDTQTLTRAPSAVPGSDATSTADAGPPPSTGARAGRPIAAYLAKYVTKSVSEFGLSPRRMSPAAIARLDVSDHIRAILTTIMDFAAHPDYADMQRWLHTLGYRGHITTNSRRFSTTMGNLRRAAWRTQTSPRHHLEKRWAATVTGQRRRPRRQRNDSRAVRRLGIRPLRSRLRGRPHPHHHRSPARPRSTTRSPGHARRACAPPRQRP